MDRVNEDTMFLHLTSQDFDGKNFIMPGAPPGTLSSDPAEELIALTTDGCTSAVAVMGPSVQIMLKDILTQTFESQSVPMNRKLWAVTVHVDGHFDYKSDIVNLHEAFPTPLHQPGLPLQHQERYALDLTHVQYGHQNETLMPWRTFVETGVRESRGNHTIGWGAENAKELMTKNFGQLGREIQIREEYFGRAITAAVREYSGWMKLWKEPDEAIFQHKVEFPKQHVTKRLDEFIALKMKDDFYKIWKLSMEKKLMGKPAKEILQKKLKSWGPDLQDPAFYAAMKVMKKRQANERKA